MRTIYRDILVLLVVVVTAVTYGGFVLAAVSPEEAAQLGRTLTKFGAEKAGNKDGTIPEYTGGITKTPPGLDPKSGSRPDPFAGEKPLFSINAANMGQYADKVTEGYKALMKKFPEYRIDVYKTHRTIYYPDWALDNTVKLATKSRTSSDGVSLYDAHGGIPFPIPKTGNEAMWNHQLRYMTKAQDETIVCFLVDRSGRSMLSAACDMWYDYPYWDPDTPKENVAWNFVCQWNDPPRIAGELMLFKEPLNLGENPRKCWIYLPGQRRVRLAPEVAFDTPHSATMGLDVYDEEQIFFGSMERYDWKLLGKKEMYITYNNYRAVYWPKMEDLGPRFLDPSSVRFELHRVWVVEATLKKGKRHVLPKRRFYIDEDSWTAVAAESYDAAGTLTKVNTLLNVPFLEVGGINCSARLSYNLALGAYQISKWGPNQKRSVVNRRPVAFFTPDALAAMGVR